MLNYWLLAEKNLIEILSELEDLEGDFVKDLNNKAILLFALCINCYESANKNKSESESRQLIIEYKKIIQSIIEKEMITKVDLDVC